MTRELRWTLIVVAALLSTAGIPTLILSGSTDDHFAWTIQPPLTAAFMGAGYWASVVTVLVAARARTWAHARVAIVNSIVFSYLTLAATLMHFDKFHQDRPVTWAWVAIYSVVPTLMAIAVVRQLRLPGGDPPRAAPLPVWARWYGIVLAAIMVPAGIALFVAPTHADVLWSWQLTPLTGRAIGAWLIGLGVGAAHIVIEADWLRAMPALAGGAAFAALQFVNVGRYSDTIDWDSPTGWLYVAGLVSVLALSVEGLRRARTAQSNENRVAVLGKAGSSQA